MTLLTLLVYFGMDYVCPSTPCYAQMIAFNASILKAVGITQGPAHLELILTTEGPVLIEVLSLSSLSYTQTRTHIRSLTMSLSVCLAGGCPAAWS